MTELEALKIVLKTTHAFIADPQVKQATKLVDDLIARVENLEDSAEARFKLAMEQLFYDGDVPIAIISADDVRQVLHGMGKGDVAGVTSDKAIADMISAAMDNELYDQALEPLHEVTKVRAAEALIKAAQQKP